MWKVGISMVTWLDIRDNPYPQTPTQSGLYLRGATIAKDKPKLILTAFRFPFVAYARKGRIFVWGRTPWGKPGRVTVLQSSHGRWKHRASLTANSNGIFSGTIKGREDRLPTGTAGRRRQGGEREEPVVLAQAAAGPSDFDLRKRRIDGRAEFGPRLIPSRPSVNGVAIDAEGRLGDAWPGEVPRGRACTFLQGGSAPRRPRSDGGSCARGPAGRRVRRARRRGRPRAARFAPACPRAPSGRRGSAPPRARFVRGCCGGRAGRRGRRRRGAPPPGRGRARESRGLRPRARARSAWAR